MADPIRRDLMGLSVDALTMERAVRRCTDAVDQDSHLSVGVINAAKIVAMRRDAQLREAVSGCGMVLADGQSVVWAGRLLGTPLPERIAGIDLFMALLAEADRRGYRVYFLGARPEVLARMLEEVARRYPGLKVAGARDGYYQPGTEAEISAEIRDRGTDIVFVGMSSPRKELFLHEWGADTGAHVLHGVGGSFDILACADPPGPGLVPAARPGMALPRPARTRPAHPPLPDHQYRLRHPGRIPVSPSPGQDPHRQNGPDWARKEHMTTTFLAVLDEMMEHPALTQVSFDDGYVPYVEIALPVLRERGLSTTFFPLAGSFGQAIRPSLTCVPWPPPA